MVRGSLALGRFLSTDASFEPDQKDAASLPPGLVLCYMILPQGFASHGSQTSASKDAHLSATSVGDGLCHSCMARSSDGNSGVVCYLDKNGASSHLDRCS